MLVQEYHPKNMHYVLFAFDNTSCRQQFTFPPCAKNYDCCSPQEHHLLSSLAVSESAVVCTKTTNNIHIRGSTQNRAKRKGRCSGTAWGEERKSLQSPSRAAAQQQSKTQKTAYFDSQQEAHADKPRPYITSPLQPLLILKHKEPSDTTSPSG